MPPDTALDLDALVERLTERLVPALVEQLRADEGRLIDLDTLAERLRMSPRGVTGLVARGELPAGYLIGGCRRWDWDSVKKHLHACGTRRPRKGRGRYPRQAGAAGGAA